MGYTITGVNGICHDGDPDVICFRDVVNDSVVSPWYEWQGISQNISMNDFLQEVEGCNLSAGNFR